MPRSPPSLQEGLCLLQAAEPPEPRSPLGRVQMKHLGSFPNSILFRLLGSEPFAAALGLRLPLSSSGTRGCCAPSANTLPSTTKCSQGRQESRQRKKKLKEKAFRYRACRCACGYHPAQDHARALGRVTASHGARSQHPQRCHRRSLSLQHRSWMLSPGSE